MSNSEGGVDTSGQAGGTPASSRRVRANTFRSIRLDPQKFSGLPFAEFVRGLLAELEALKRERSAFYEELRRSNSRWANGARRLLAILAAVALFLTALVAVVRFAPGTLPVLQGDDADKGLLVWVLVIYAVMGAISVYEKGSDKTTATSGRLRPSWRFVTCGRSCSSPSSRNCRR